VRTPTAVAYRLRERLGVEIRAGVPERRTPLWRRERGSGEEGHGGLLRGLSWHAALQEEDGPGKGLVGISDEGQLNLRRSIRVVMSTATLKQWSRPRCHVAGLRPTVTLDNDSKPRGSPVLTSPVRRRRKVGRCRPAPRRFGCSEGSEQSLVHGIKLPSGAEDSSELGPPGGPIVHTSSR